MGKKEAVRWRKNMNHMRGETGRRKKGEEEIRKRRRKGVTRRNMNRLMESKKEGT
jgi:hypothetical protein